MALNLLKCWLFQRSVKRFWRQAAMLLIADFERRALQKSFLR
jgi:hypothetical protein